MRALRGSHVSLLGWLFIAYGALSLSAMAPMSLGAAALFAAICFSLISTNGKKSLASLWKIPVARHYTYLSALLLLAAALSLLGGILFPLNYGGRHAQVHFFGDMAKAWYFVWPVVLALGLARLTRDERRLAFSSWLIAFFGFSILGITQHFTGWPRPQLIPGSEHRYHATVFLGHHLSVASIFIFPFFAVLDLARGKKGEKWLGLPQWFFYAAALAGAATLFLTYSRTLWAALPVGVVLWIVLSLPRKWAGAAITVILLGGLALTQVPAIKTRILNPMGISERRDLWEANWEFFRNRPLTGVGLHKNEELSGLYLLQKYPGTSVFSGHAHNNLIEMLGGTGLLGFVSWVLWCAMAFRVSRKMGLWSAGITCAWLVFHLNGLTQVNFWEGKVQHQMMWILGWGLFSAANPKENPS